MHALCAFLKSFSLSLPCRDPAHVYGYIGFCRAMYRPMYVYVWLCTAMYGYLGLCRAMWGYVGLSMAM